MFRKFATLIILSLILFPACKSQVTPETVPPPTQTTTPTQTPTPKPTNTPTPTPREIAEGFFLQGAAHQNERQWDLAIEAYAKADSDENLAMIEHIRERLKLTSLKYQRMDDLVNAIGLPKEKLCTHCWDGSSYF